MRLRVADIQRAVCGHFGLSREDLLSDRLVREISVPRQICCYLARELTPSTYSHIARMMNRDHSTVIYAAHVMRERWRERGMTYHHINRIRSKIIAEMEKDSEKQTALEAA